MFLWDFSLSDSPQVALLSSVLVSIERITDNQVIDNSEGSNFSEPTKSLEITLRKKPKPDVKFNN